MGPPSEDGRKGEPGQFALVLLWHAGKAAAQTVPASGQSAFG